jgi:hypothetical protein
MHRRNPFALAVLIAASLIASASAQMTTAPPTGKDAVTIISTHDDINPGLYKVIHITPGKQLGENGFMSENVVRVTAFAPESAGRPKRVIRHYLLQHDAEYGWYIETVREDTRGVYVEISSQIKGRVFVR